MALGIVKRPASPLWKHSRLLLALCAASLTVAFAGLVCIIVAPFASPEIFDNLWGVEPLTYIGALLLMTGLGATGLGMGAAVLNGNAPDEGEWTREEQNNHWRETTEQFFRLFDHDLGRPLRRIAGKQREVQAALEAAGEQFNPTVQELMDEIARQTPNFRLMLSNIEVLVQLEAPGDPPSSSPVEPSQIVRRIADRYTPVAAEMNKEITWWAEPAEFGMASSDPHAIEHIVTNLVDNAVAHAESRVDVTLTRDDARFHIGVWDDGPGIAAQYLEYVFDRGWTPEVGQREEKTSSGLGLFIARTLARRCGGDVTVESAPEPQDGHHTSFLLSLPLTGR